MGLLMSLGLPPLESLPSRAAAGGSHGRWRGFAASPVLDAGGAKRIDIIALYHHGKRVRRGCRTQ